MARQGRDTWIRLVGELERSGLSQVEFAARRGLVVSTLRWWVHKLRGEARREEPRLLPVRVVASPAPEAREAAPLEIVLPSGVRVRCPAGTEPRYVAELVAALA
jgi:transposase-like protein